jgi:hypothetical protein
MNEVKLTPYQYAEKKLNTLRFEGMPLGDLSAHFFDRTWLNLFETSLLKNGQILTVALLKALTNQLTPPRATSQTASQIKTDTVLLYHKSGGNRHHEAMERAVRMVHSAETPLVVVGPKGHSDLPTGRVFYQSGLITLCKAIAYQVSQRRTIQLILSETPLTRKQRINYHLHLTLQMLKGCSGKRFLHQQERLKLICVDYDRNGFACTLIAAAKSLKLPTITLQHGIIYPPYSFMPLLADSCWVWGEMAKQQFISAGEPVHKIVCVGTPIVEPLQLSETAKETARQRLQLKSGKTILLALSWPDKKVDSLLAAFLAAIKTLQADPEANYLVKTHPSHPHIDYCWLETDYGLKHLPANVAYVDVMNLVDVLLTHTSGIAAEAIYYGKQVGIINLPGYDAGSGMELHTRLGVPLLNTPEDIQNLMVPLDAKHQNAATQAALKATSEATSKAAFYLTGMEAAHEIAGRLEALLRKSEL